MGRRPGGLAAGRRRGAAGRGSAASTALGLIPVALGASAAPIGSARLSPRRISAPRVAVDSVASDGADVLLAIGGAQAIAAMAKQQEARYERALQHLSLHNRYLTASEGRALAKPDQRTFVMELRATTVPWHYLS